MKTSKKLIKKFITFMISLLLLSYLNVIPVLAANVNSEDSIIASRTVIPSWGDHTVSGTPHYSSGFGIRDNQSVRLDVNIIYRTSDYPLSILVYTRDGSTCVASTNLYSTGSHTFNLPGGTYFIAFNTRGGAVKFNYNITI